MGLSKMLKSASARPAWLDCQRSAVLLPHLHCLDGYRSEIPLPHFCSALTAKDLMFRFRTSALPWLPKIWSSTSELSFCTDCQKCEVSLPHFRSALTAEYVKFCFRISALPWLAKIWSSTFCTCTARTSKDVKFRFAFILFLDFQRFAVSCLHFRLILTANDLKIGFSTNTLPSLPNMGSSASALPFCLDWKRAVVSHFRSAFIPKDVNALLLCLDWQSSASSVPL